MTPSTDAAIDSAVESATTLGTDAAATGLLRIVGASGAVCVDGSCSIDPVVQPPQEGDRAGA